MFKHMDRSLARNLSWFRRGLLLTLIFSALVATSAQANIGPRDLGDAPDASNNAGVGMSAYPGVPALFPSVYNPGAGAVQGPLHKIDLDSGFWLGPAVTRENDADVLPDADGITNIDPAANDANRDGADDSIFNAAQPGIALPLCMQTQFNYQITVAPGGAMMLRYTNVWFDYNRDGDWQDVFNCPNGVQVSEWAVQNQTTNLAAGSAVVATPLFTSMTPQNGRLWMRITLSEQPAPMPADGRGPGTPYAGGETEDYLLIYNPGSQTFTPGD